MIRPNMIDIFRFNRYLKHKIKNPIDVSELIREEGLDGAVHELDTLFLNHPKVVFPKFMVNSIENTGQKLFNMDFGGFHLDVAMALSYRVLQAKKEGRECAQAVDIYINDLKDYFDFREEDNLMPLFSKTCSEIVSGIVKSNIDKYLILEAQQIIVTFNKFSVFTHASDFVYGDPVSEWTFIRSCKRHIFEQMGLEEAIRQWMNAFVNYVLPSWVESDNTIESIENRGDLFREDVDNVFNLAKGFEAVDEGSIIHPFDREFNSTIANWSIIGGSGIEEKIQDDEFNKISNLVQYTMKGFFGYIELFKDLAYGYNTGMLSDEEWGRVLETYGDFYVHCTE